MSDMPHMLPLDRLQPHPGNPRLVERTDVIEQLAALIREHGFDTAHAIIVRRLGEGWFQIISGHNRVRAAAAAERPLVPAWVREMTDDEAYMALVLCNAQGELTAIERGMHAMNSGQAIKAYAAAVGRIETTVAGEVRAARVCKATETGAGSGLGWSLFAEIHAAQPWLWRALVAKVVGEELNHKTTRALVAVYKDAPKQKWAFAWDRIGEHVVRGTLARDDVQGMIDTFQHFVDVWDAKDDLHPDLLLEGGVDTVLDGHNVSTPAQLKAVLQPLLAELEGEPAQERAVSLFSVVSLDEWNELDEATRRILLDPAKLPATGAFNVQTGDGIDWAKWSWNPITGCLHDCPYCYARDIATIGNTARAFPHGFAPALKPVQLNTPRNMRVPKGAGRDVRLRNVFCGSMADWWGRWVPDEWIIGVLNAMRAAPGLNFLTLTKFPNRMAEFDIPGNTWAGTTVDRQARVAVAERAFARIEAPVRWLSIEPMLDNLRFSRLDLFHWMVIGGASRSSRTPEWKPPFAWIVDLLAQAREAGVAVYMKPNLLGHRALEMPGGLPVPQDYPAEPPAVFDYLGRGLQAKPLPERRTEASA